MPRSATMKKPAKTVLRDVSAAPATSNGPDRDVILFFTGQFRGSDDKIKEARTARKKVRQAAKLQGIDVEQLDKAIAEMDREDGTTIEQLSSFKRYCEFLGLPIGSQMTLFDDPKAATGTSRESINAKARRQGYERGLQGLNPDMQAFPPITQEGEEHQRGWSDGQQVLKDKFVRLSEEMAAAEKAKAAKKAEKADAEPPKEEGEEEHQEAAE